MLLSHLFLRGAVDEAASLLALPGEAHRQTCYQLQLTDCCAVRVDARHHCIDIDIEKCSGPAQLAVLLVGDNLILERGVDESVHEFAVGASHCAVIQAEFAGEFAQRLPLLGTELQVGDRNIKQLHIRRDVDIGVDAASEGCQVGCRGEDVDVPLARTHPQWGAEQWSCDSWCASVGVVIGCCEQQPRRGAGVSDCAVCAIERDTAFGAGLAELAASRMKCVERVPPVDIDSGAGQFVADHAGVEPDVVADDHRAIKSRRHMVRHIGEGWRPAHHAGVDAVDPGRAYVAQWLN
ncbi:hypothetical protein MCHLDSM_03192 [Mycolicibacterium chlorophenolicum]|uniref:Uncharacterized protein n=1 Tax=Mycolicibacterium chlorophenolicum TaxID=37916 RepID=A0A0J6W299_9MYCO|nr:hypothetical protein MCHLDSM_03192 [Mycolicibacterium chlorophenolicum]